jgi:Tol biopolymer transport system component
MMMQLYKLQRLLVYLLVLFGWATATGLAQQPTFTITRVSVATGGGEANDEAGLLDISDDGRYVVFVSRADTLVPNDTNAVDDIFVHDRQTGETERVSVASDGTESNGFSTSPAISADGRYVAFTSGATNLIPDDAFPGGKILLRDRQQGTTTLISVNSAGVQADGNSYGSAISPDGAYVAFVSNAANLDERVGRQFRDHIYLHHRTTGETRLLSVNSRGEVADDRSGNFLGGGIAVSRGGNVVAFVSSATNLVDDDTNDARDIFLYRNGAATLQRISLAPGGAQGNGDALSVRMSDDGRRILFDSLADNLVDNDTNDTTDLFLYDSALSDLRLVSKSRDGGVGEGADGDISADGRYVSYASNTGLHVANDCGPLQNCVYRYDTVRDETTLLSVDGTGAPAGSYSQEARIAGDGQVVAFQSLWDGFVADDTNEVPDIFVYVDGAGPPPAVTAAFRTDVRQAPDGRFVLPWGAAEDLPITIGLEQAQGVTVTVPLRVLDGAERVTDHLITFPPGVTEQAFVLAKPRDVISTTYSLQLLTGEPATRSASHQTPRSPQLLTSFIVAFLGSDQIGDETEYCYYVAWCQLMQMAGWHNEDCFLLPFEPPVRNAAAPTASMLETLYTTRDTRMATTAVGRYYINLYYSHSPEVTNILLHHPPVLWASWDGITAWLPALAALNDGGGSEVLISDTMVADLEAVLALLTTHGSAELQRAIATQRAQLAPASYVGLTMDEAWAQVNEQPMAELYLPLVQR